MNVSLSPSVRHNRVRIALASLALFIALAVIHTWPLASAPDTFSRNDTADTVLHEWIMSWVAHQILTNPLHLFDANIFYPERQTLAYSDHLFVQSMLGAPLLWAGASPVLAYNLVLIAGLALTGWTTSLVVGSWTGNWLAGILSGSLLAFNSFSLTRLPQLQDLHVEFFPLALFALDRLLAVPNAKHALSLACWYVLQSLTGTYLMVFTSISLVAAAAARPREWLGPSFRALAPWAVLAAVVSVLALVPFLIPYFRASRDAGLERSLADTVRYSAEITDYLAAAGRLHFELWSGRFFQGDALFPGVTALALAGIAVGSGQAFNDRRARMVLAIGLAAFALSFGPAFTPYRWLYAVFPLMSGIRGAVRFGQIVLAAVGILAGFGLAHLQRRFPSRRMVLLSLALLAAAHIEALRAPMGYTPNPGIPAVYDVLRRTADNAVLVWVPFQPSPRFHLNAPYMLASTRFWKPMLNGYSGFKPASYYEHAKALANFPDEASIQYLREHGVTHVVVDGAEMKPDRTARLTAFPQLTLLADDGNLRIYLL